MTNYIKQWWEQSKAQTQADNVAKLRDSFYLKEKNGSIWIMHEGVAVFKVPSFASSEETVAYLEETRGYAIECAFGIPYEHKKGKRHIWDIDFPKGEESEAMLYGLTSFSNERADL